MAGTKRAVLSPVPSAERNGSAVASSSCPKRGPGRPKKAPASSAVASSSNSKRGPGRPKKSAASTSAARERSAPGPGKDEKGKPATPKKKEPEKAESQEEGRTLKNQQASGGATARPTKRKKNGGEAEPEPPKQKGGKRGKQQLSGEVEKPAPAPTPKKRQQKEGKREKQQASGGAEKATPSKRKRGDAEPQEEAKSEKKGSPANKRKDKAAAAAAGADPGACSFPMARVRLLMRAEDANIRPTSETVFLINKASELFLDTFAEDAYQNALTERKKSIIYDNLSTAVCNQKRYKFLSDFVPLKVTAGDALKATALDQS